MIEVKAIRKDYGHQRVLDGLDLTLALGEAAVICGASGSGKSTLLRLIAGLEPLDAGTIHIDGSFASDSNHTAPPGGRGIGMLFQEPLLWPHMTAAQNIAFALGNTSRDQAQVRVAALLEEAGLVEVGSKRPHQLSGGQARRVALLRALAAAPPILLLDEPLVHLDPNTSAAMLALVAAHRAEHGPAVLWVTHKPGDAPRLGARLLRLEDGRLADAHI